MHNNNTFTTKNYLKVPQISLFSNVTQRLHWDLGLVNRNAFRIVIINKLHVDILTELVIPNLLY